MNTVKLLLRAKLSRFRATWVRNNAFWLPDDFIVSELNRYCDKLEPPSPPESVEPRPGQIQLKNAFATAGLSIAELDRGLRSLAHMAGYGRRDVIGSLHPGPSKLWIMTSEGESELSEMSREQKLAVLSEFKALPSQVFVI